MFFTIVQGSKSYIFKKLHFFLEHCDVLAHRANLIGHLIDTRTINSAISVRYDNFIYCRGNLRSYPRSLSQVTVVVNRLLTREQGHNKIKSKRSALQKWKADFAKDTAFKQENLIQINQAQKIAHCS